MKKAFYLLIILISFNFIANSQLYFQKTIGGTSNEGFRAVKQTSDGGFIIGGYTTSFGSGSIDLLVVKTDINGDTSWVRTYGTSSYDDGFDIIETVGGNFILLGQTNAYGNSDEVFLLNLDINGNIVWVKTYGSTGSDRGIRVLQTPDLGFIIGGITYSLGNSSQFYLIKTDNSGNLQWTNSYGGAANDFLYGLDLTSDGGYVLTGETSSFGQGSSDVLVVKVDASGNEVWSGSYGMSNYEYGYFIQETSDNGFVVIGVTRSTGAGGNDVLLIKLNSLGTLSWAKTYGSDGSEYGWEIRETPDLGLVLMCQSNRFGYGSSNAYVVRTDNLGNLMWSNVYGGILGEYFLSGWVINTNELIFAGSTASFGSGNEDSYLVKTDSLGIAYGCYTRIAATIVNSAPFIQATPTLITAIGGTENTVSPLSVYTNAIIEDVCPCYFNDTLTVFDALCFGDNNGSAIINVWGGTAPYNYLWSTLSTNDTINNLIAGDYYVVVSDYFGCSAVDTAIVSEPYQLVDTLFASNVNCYGGSDGSIIADIYGGTVPYNLLWSNTQINDTISNLNAGWYYLTVTDDHLCTIIDSIEVTQPDELLIDSLLQTDVLCFGDSTGTASAYLSGGTIPYYYQWSNGDTLLNSNNLPYGWVYITVSDDHSCMKNDSIFIDQPDLLVDSIIYQNVLCYNDSNGWAVSTPNGGIAPYSYLWSNSSTNDSIINLYPSVFYLTVTDDNGCVVTDSVIITQPDLLQDSLTHFNVNCFGFNDAGASVFPYGGTNPYLYEWSTDNDTLSFIDSLTAGWYFITVTDTNNCFVIDSVEITQPEMLVDSMQQINVSCFGGNDAATIIYPFGGTIPYYFEWSTSVNDTIDHISNLNAGWYYVTVIDDHNCIITDSVEITQPDLLVVNDSVVDVLCFGGNDGMVFLTPSGGTTPYYYNWFDSSTNSDIYNLYAGTYAVTVTDANGCTIMIPKIDVGEPDELVFYLDPTLPLCYGNTNGVINSYVDGGTLPYSYLWESGETDSVLLNIPTGLYTLTVTDSHSCTATDSIYLNQPTPLALTDSIYIEEYQGNIDISVSGGTFPYGYLWSDGTAYEDNFYLISGTYQVTVNDFNGCEIFGNYIIDIPFIIPTLFTPNGDGYNDNWEVTNLNYYNDISIEIFNRWGDVVFEFTGSGFEYDNNRWDGKYNGNDLPMGSYVYIIDLKNGLEPYNGVVSIKR